MSTGPRLTRRSAAALVLAAALALAPATSIPAAASGAVTDASASIANAVTTASISGRLVDAAGHALPGLVVGMDLPRATGAYFTEQLKRTTITGEPIADRTAWRITSPNGWWSSFGKKKSKNGKRPGPPVYDDLCAQVDEHGRTRHVFAAQRLDELWLTDITEHSAAEGKVYMCAIKDAFSGRIVGYAIESRMKSSLVVRAIVTWIERTYHRRRRHARLGRLTPMEFETILTTQVALAA